MSIYTASSVPSTITINSSSISGPVNNGIIDSTVITVPPSRVEVEVAELTKSVSEIKERLNILTPALALEQEWKELQVIGEQYRTLEKHLLEKQQMWSALKGE